jgi:hypothetical protein
MMGRLKDPLLWLRFVALLCMLLGGLLRMAEPDTWLGHLFASRYDAVTAGYRTLLQGTVVDRRPDRPAWIGTPLTRNDPGFQEILELVFASDKAVTDLIATGRMSPIETIYAQPGGPGGLRPRSTVERMFIAPITIELHDGQRKFAIATLDYTEAELKGYYFMPKLRWWALLAVWAGFITNVLLPFSSSRKTPQPTREE